VSQWCVVSLGFTGKCKMGHALYSCKKKYLFTSGENIQGDSTFLSH
jgi:hypothetical protein